jgi:hypothetical protein
VGGRDTVVVEGASDLGEAVPARVLQTDPLDDVSRERRRTACVAALARLTGRLEVLAEEALQLGGGDQPLAPGGLHRAQQGHYATVDRGDADPERFGGLLAAVGEAIGLFDLLLLAGWRPDPFRLAPVLA